MALTILSLGLNSCKKQTSLQKEGQRKAPIPFSPYVITDSSRFDTLTNGLVIYHVEDGVGAIPQQGSHIAVHYLGILPDGKIFDSSWERGESFSFNINKNQVIQGWDIGISQLTYGSKAILYIPAELGYGKNGFPPNIPPNSPLVFHVEILGAF